MESESLSSLCLLVLWWNMDMVKVLLSWSGGGGSPRHLGNVLQGKREIPLDDMARCLPSPVILSPNPHSLLWPKRCVTTPEQLDYSLYCSVSKQNRRVHFPTPHTFLTMATVVWIHVFDQYWWHQGRGGPDECRLLCCCSFSSFCNFSLNVQSLSSFPQLPTQC